VNASAPRRGVCLFRLSAHLPLKATTYVLLDGSSRGVVRHVDLAPLAIDHELGRVRARPVAIGEVPEAARDAGAHDALARLVEADAVAEYVREDLQRCGVALGGRAHAARPFARFAARAALVCCARACATPFCARVSTTAVLST